MAMEIKGAGCHSTVTSSNDRRARTEAIQLEEVNTDRDGNPLPSGDGRMDEETESLPVAIQSHHIFDIVGMATHDIVPGMPWFTTVEAPLSHIISCHGYEVSSLARHADVYWEGKHNNKALKRDSGQRTIFDYDGEANALLICLLGYR